MTLLQNVDLRHSARPAIAALPLAAIAGFRDMWAGEERSDEESHRGEILRFACLPSIRNDRQAQNDRKTPFFNSPRMTTLINVLTSIFLFSQILTTTGCDNHFAMYKNSQYKFRIKYPKTWQVVENTDGAAVVFVSPKENSLDVYQENFGIAVQPTRVSGHMLEYTRDALHQIVNISPDIQIVRNEPEILSENAARRLEYIQQLNNHLKITRVWTMIGDNTYDLIFACDIDRCGDYLGIVNTLFSSFKVDEN